MTRTREARFEVNFVSSFIKRDSISHGSETDQRADKTLCGRSLKNAETIHEVAEFLRPFEPDCITCRKALTKEK